MASSTVTKPRRRESFKLSARPEMQPGTEEMREAVQRSISIAIAEGRHSPRRYCVCHVCRERVDGIYYIGFGGTEMCGACADLIGQGPLADAKKFEDGKKRR